MRPHSVKRALLNGEVQIGTWVTVLRTPQIAQTLATAGFDFMYIDMEHSILSIETVGGLCFAALAAGLVPIVRPPAKEWIAKGIRLVPSANEVSLLVNAGARAVGEIRRFAKEPR